MNAERHRTQVRVLYGDVDAMKFAYYGQYMRWFEIGRAEYMRARGLSYAEVERRGTFLPVHEAYCKYRRPIRYDDLIFIEAWPDSLRKVSAQFNYRLLDPQERILATGYTVHVCMDRDGRMIRMPDFLAEALSSGTP